MDVSDPRLHEEAYGLQRQLGFDLTGWRADWARVELCIAPHLLNRQGLVHGGIHATLLDTAMGYSGCFTGDPEHRIFALTLSMTVNYVSQANGLRLVAEAERTGGGRTTFFAEGRLADDTGTEVARASGVFRYRR